MKKTIVFALFALSAIVLCCCNNKKEKCYDCTTLNVAIPEFEKKFPEKMVTMGPDYFINEEKTIEMVFSSMEEAEYKIAHCIRSEESPFSIDGSAYLDIMKQVIRSDDSSMDYPFDTLVKKSTLTVVDSEDGLVRCYGWHHLYGTCHMNPELMVQYRERDGKIYTVDNYDFANGDYVPEDMYNILPEKVFRFKNGDETYTFIWGIFASSVGEGKSYYGLLALQMDEKGVFPAYLFRDFADNELHEGIDLEYDIYINESEPEPELIRFDKDEPAFYFLESDHYVKFAWDGEAFYCNDNADFIRTIL